MTERVLSKAQAAEICAHCATLCDKVRSFEFRKALNIEQPRLRIERFQLQWFGHVSRMCHGKLASHVLQATPTEKRPRILPITRVVITSPTLLGLVLIPSQHSHLRYC